MCLWVMVSSRIGGSGICCVYSLSTKTKHGPTEHIYIDDIHMYVHMHAFRYLYV